MSPKLREQVEQRAAQIITAYQGRGRTPEPWEVTQMLNEMASWTYHVIDDGFNKLRDVELADMRAEILDKDKRIADLQRQVNQFYRNQNTL